MDKRHKKLDAWIEKTIEELAEVAVEPSHKVHRYLADKTFALILGVFDDEVNRVAAIVFMASLMRGINLQMSDGCTVQDAARREIANFRKAQTIAKEFMSAQRVARGCERDTFVA